MMLHVARRVLPCVRYAKNACKLRISLSRMHSDKASGHDVDYRTVVGVGATPPFGTQRQAKLQQEQLLELIKLTGDVQDRVKRLDEAVSEGKEALPSPVELEKVHVLLQYSAEGVEIISEKVENQMIACAFEGAAIPFCTTNDINYLLWRQFHSINTNIYIDHEGVIREEVTRSVSPVIKELIIRPLDPDDNTVSLFISNQFILLLEKEDVEGLGFRIATKALYSPDGVLQPATTILNRNAWFIKEMQGGLENFFIQSVPHQDTCIQAGTDTPLKAVTSGAHIRNLDSVNVGRLD